MIPFKEKVIDGETRTIPWNYDKSMAKLREIRSKHIARLNGEDVQKARSANYEIETECLPTTRVGEDGNLTIDPVLSRIKHSGAKTNDAWIPEWRAFCSKPQNDDNVEYPCAEYKPKEVRQSDGPISVAPMAKEPQKTRRKQMESL